ncbi:MAG: DUF4430 domain-containing protein [Candidatus Levyibacteriota bacterium]|nr:MAG: DUF4430 domain-containing protein [Candidatus Levybacteria bacterium]
MEEQNNRRFANIFIGILILLIIGYFGYGYIASQDAAKKSAELTTQNKPTPTIVLVDYVKYQGKTGKNAMQLLQEKSSVETATSGLIIAINGRRADNAKREYWAFYVNGKLATVGSSDYQTKDEDMIEWKIDKY